MSDNTTKFRTITLTNRPPVRICDDQWPVLARGNHESYEGQYKSQANRTTDIDIRVRQHADGRAIVYGVYDHMTRWQGEHDERYRFGMLCEPGADLVAAIHEIGRQIASRTESDSVADAVAECIANLPAVDL